LTQREPHSANTNCRQRLMVQLWNQLVRTLIAIWTFVSFVVGLPVTMIRSLARHSLNGRFFNQAASKVSLNCAGLSLQTQSHRLSSVAAPNINDQMPQLPHDVVQYSQLPSGGKVFTATTIPKGLLHQHSTKRGSWGVIRVSQGQLEYQIHNADDTDNISNEQAAAAEPVPSSTGSRTFILHSKQLGIIEPTVLHQVRPLTDDVEFVVEFYKLPGSRHNAVPNPQNPPSDGNL
jgi:tellurite resistance-related uncharacterized protein